MYVLYAKERKAKTKNKDDMQKKVLPKTHFTSADSWHLQ
jgi:hypothetical protein